MSGAGSIAGGRFTATGMARAAAGVIVIAVAWLVAAATLPRGLPPGVVFNGVVYGSLYALIAIGLVLIYRANRVINFAQAQFGAVAAVVAIELDLHWGVPYLLAVPAGFVIALLTGALVDKLVMSRFRNTPRLILSVATIGLAQILTGIAVLIPLAVGAKSGKLGATQFTTPFKAHFFIRPVVFNANYVVAVVVVVAIMMGLAAFLRFTDYGIAIRAAAENSDRAGLLGIPVPRLNTVVWSLAALLSAVAVILRTPIQGFSSMSVVSSGGNALLLRTLAAAVIGKMENLPRTVIAAIGIGIFEYTAIWATSNTVIVDAMLVAVILVALLVQRDFFQRSLETGISSFRAIREVRPVPTELKGLAEVELGGLALSVVLLAAAVALPFFLTPGKQQLAAFIAIDAMVAVSLVVLTGWSMQISLGQFALVGFAGATTGILYQNHHWDFMYASVAGIVVAILVSLCIGLPALRIRGPFLAVTTLAFAVSASTYFLSPRYFSWFVPTRVDRPVLWNRISLDSDMRLYFFCLVCLALSLGMAASVRKTRTGRAIIAVRDNEAAAQTVTLNATKLKLVSFMLSGAIAGFAGVAYVVHQQGIQTGAFNADASIQLFSMVVIGGLGSLPGAVLGAVYVGMTEYLLPPGWSLLATGFGILFLLMILPEGVGGFVFGLRDRYLRWVADRHHIVVPSLVADMRVESTRVAVAEPVSLLETDRSPAAPVDAPDLVGAGGGSEVTR